MKKISKTLELDGVETGFWAERSDCDSDGNVIKDHYATAAEMSNISDKQKSADIQVAEIKQANKRNAENINNVDGKAIEANKVAKSASKKVDKIESDVRNLSQSFDDLSANTGCKLDELEQDIEKNVKDTHDKGLFVSLAVLLRAVAHPHVGDSAFVIVPCSYGTVTFDPLKYWGGNYVGKKTEKETTWHNNIQSAKGKFIENANKYYQVLNATYQTLADLSIADLVTHGHVEEVVITTYQNADSIPFLLYICEEEGVWENTTFRRTFEVVTTIEASNVIDDNKDQSKINLVARSNAKVENLNFEKFTKAFNELANQFNMLQEVAIVDGDYKKAIISPTSFARVVEDGTDEHKYLGVSTLPFILS